ncbi:MAG: hypothetical protein Kow00109_02200 [Acidobacteriota bacterium]
MTTVRIYQRDYEIRGGDPAYVQELASLLDQRMNEVAARTPTVDTLKIAILAGLSLADEYVSTRRQLQSLRYEVTGRLQRLLRKLDAVSEPDPSESDSLE